ncbi:MAG: GAF domain-containing protein [Elusimicrobia bacterium]|nr:GAF domain-containing protein [Elusimicrobiota bacterium]
MGDMEILKLAAAAAQKIAACRTSAEAWKTAVEFAGEHMKCEAGSYFSVDASGKLLTLEYAFGDFASDLSRLSFSLQGIVGHAVQHKTAVTVNDAQSNHHFCAKVDSATGFTTKTVLAVPAVENGAVCGVVEMMNRSFYNNGSFSEDDRDLLEMLVMFALKAAKRLPKEIPPQP